MVYLGALESHQSIKADVNIFTDSQVEWLSDLHELPSFAQGIKS
ncbi:hypothetical protein JCM19238_242 [Vibrio ponticus]|nr:hypothetical protein JCM19238_242 [Vibrio ponticus]